MSIRSPKRIVYNSIGACLALVGVGVTTAVDVVEASEPASRFLVFFGTYTRGDGQGVYVSRFDASNGSLEPAKLAGELKNPSFVALHPDGNHLYAVGELADFQGKKRTGGVTAFSIDRKSGKLKMLNQQTSGGAGPCHVVVDPSGRNVLAANYGGGSVVSLPIRDGGKLQEPASFIQHTGSSVNQQRQQAPHAHSINVDATGKFAVAADLGTDKLYVYKLDAKTGKLTPNDPPSVSVEPGSGPRHFAFHPDGRHAYVINELALTVTVFDWNAKTGVLETKQTISTIPGERQDGYSTAEVRVHPSGRFVYGSNRGHDTIAVFAVDEKTGKLTVVENESTGGKTPRNFNIDPTGKYLLAANQATDNVVVFKIDQKTGALEPTGTEIKVATPVCIRFLPVN